MVDADTGRYRVAGAALLFWKYAAVEIIRLSFPQVLHIGSPALSDSVVDHDHTYRHHHKAQSGKNHAYGHISQNAQLVKVAASVAAVRGGRRLRMMTGITSGVALQSRGQKSRPA